MNRTLCHSVFATGATVFATEATMNRTLCHSVFATEATAFATEATIASEATLAQAWDLALLLF